MKQFGAALLLLLASCSGSEQRHKEDIIELTKERTGLDLDSFPFTILNDEEHRTGTFSLNFQRSGLLQVDSATMIKLKKHIRNTPYFGALEGCDSITNPAFWDSLAPDAKYGYWTTFPGNRLYFQHRVDGRGVHHDDHTFFFIYIDTAKCLIDFTHSDYSRNIW